MMMQDSQEMQIQSLGQEDTREEVMTTHYVFLPGESYGQRRQAGYSPWGRKESDTTGNLAWTRALESSHCYHRFGF